MNHRDAFSHLTGESLYVDDIALPAHCLHAAVVTSPVANGTLLEVDIESALSMPGVKAILRARDIPGLNQIGDILPDERLLTEHHLNFIGKAVALVLADTSTQAHAAAANVHLRYETHAAIFTARDAYHQHSTFGDERQFRKGDCKTAFEQAAWSVSGQVDTQAQEHLYFETQTALAIPHDGTRLKIFCASQNPSSIQKFAARILGISMNAIEVEVPRLGGAFGGKEEQAKTWALLAALGAFVTQQPVKLTLTRQEDMHWTGKRHPYSARYRLAADRDGKLLAYEVQFLQDGGAVADLSTAILERTLFHATNAYAIPNVDVKAVSCRTHHPSNTAFRGFGAPQAIFTLECALDHLSQTMQLPRWQIQQKNLLQPGYQFDYGMTVQTLALQQCWQQLWETKSIAQRLAEIESSNRQAPRYKKSLALTPLCFGISFTATHLNQASVNVNIYTDGSIGVAISAVEMGQGVTEKIRTVVARCFDLPLDLIRIDYTNSSKTANMSPTAASVGADLNGMAAWQACTALKKRLCEFASTQLQVPTENLELNAGKFCVTKKNSDDNINHRSDREASAIEWTDLISRAYLARINLAEHAYYATPDLYFDRTREQGNPFAYHVYGVSAIEATLDSLLGVYTVDTIDVVYDLGESLDPQSDLGQMEGGLVQGVGYTTLEEIIWDADGQLLTDSFATYKIPDLLHAPRISIDFIASPSNPHGPFSAKAIGEPPFLLGLGAWFAVADAIRASNPPATLAYALPMTPEKALLALIPESAQATAIPEAGSGTSSNVRDMEPPTA